MNPRVSILIPTYNRAASGYLKEAVDSALHVDYADREILVIDDGSTDATEALVASYGHTVRYHRQENRGASAARNSGLRLARGDYVALLDSDDLYLPNRLEKQVAILDGNPWVALVYGQMIAFNEATGEERLRPRPREITEGRIFERVYFGNMIPALTATFRRTVALELGGFDESLRGSEDWELWLRISARHEVRCVPETLARYRVHDTNKSKHLDFLLANEIAALEACRAKHPELTATLGRRGARQVGRKCARLGRKLQRKGERAEAHRRFSQALDYGFKTPKVWINWLRTRGG